MGLLFIDLSLALAFFEEPQVSVVLSDILLSFLCTNYCRSQYEEHWIVKFSDNCDAFTS